MSWTMKIHPIENNAECDGQHLSSGFTKVDPLKCPNCGGEMKMIRFIEKRQTDVIEKILKHCDLWIDPRDRGPPSPLLDDQFDLELEYVDCNEVLMEF